MHGRAFGEGAAAADAVGDDDRVVAGDHFLLLKTPAGTTRISRSLGDCIVRSSCYKTKNK